MIPLIIKEKLLAEFTKEGLQKYFRHTGWNFIGRIVSLVVSFAVNIYVVRSLGPENYGLISYVISFVSIFGIFSSFGIDSTLYIDLAKDPKDKDRILGTGFVLKFAGAVATFLLVFGYVLVSKDNFFIKTAMMLYTLSVFSAPFNVVNSFFQAKAFSKPTVINAVVISVVLSFLKFFVVYRALDLHFFLAIFVLEAVLYSGGYVFMYKKYGNSIRAWFFDWSFAKKMLSLSWPLMLSNASILVYSRVDQVIIGKLLNTESVGLYDAAVKLAEMWYFFPAIVIGSLFPAIINAQKVGKELYERRLMQLYSTSFYLSLVFIIPITFFSKDIIRFFYGDVFMPSATVLSIYVWAGLWVSIGSALSQVLINEKHTKVIFVSNFLPMVFNIALNIILIPKYHINGAAIATAFSYAFMPCTALFFKETRHHAFRVLKSVVFKIN